MRTLFNLTEEQLRLFDRLERYAEESGGEVPPELDAEIEQISRDRTEKIAAICGVYKEMTARAVALGDAAKKLKARATAAENQAEALKSYLQRNLTEGEVIEVGTHRVGWRKSSSVELLPGVAVEDIPELFQRREVSFNKSEATRGIKAGEDLWFCEMRESIKVQIS